MADWLLCLIWVTVFGVAIVCLIRIIFLVLSTGKSSSGNQPRKYANESKRRVLKNLKKEEFTEIYRISEGGQQNCDWKRCWARIKGDKVQIVVTRNYKVEEMYESNKWTAIERNFRFKKHDLEKGG